MPGETFGKSQRLLNAKDYSYVFDKATIKVSHKHYLVLARKNTLGQARLGLVVAKKNVRQANQRNRIKRVVRETFRKNQHSLDSFDIIFLARRGLNEIEPGTQYQIMVKAWQRLINKARNES